MDFHYNRYEVTNGANLKYQKAEIKKEEKEEPQRSVVPEKEPVKQEEVMTGREALASINRAMVNNLRANNPQGPFSIRWEHPETEVIEMVRRDYLSAKQDLLVQRIDHDDISDIEKLIEYATYLQEKDSQFSEEYSKDIVMFNKLLDDLRGRGGSRNGEGNVPLRGGDEPDPTNNSTTVSNNKAVSDNLRAEEEPSGENPTSLQDLIDEKNQIWNYVKELLREYNIIFEDNFEQIGDDSSNQNNEEITQPLIKLRELMITAGQGELLDELKGRVEDYFIKLDNYHQNVENSDEEISKNNLKHQMHFGIWVALLGN